MTAAKAKGATVMTGRELAIYAAADAFELFTGYAPVNCRDGNCIRQRDGKKIRRLIPRAAELFLGGAMTAADETGRPG